MTGADGRLTPERYLACLARDVDRLVVAARPDVTLPVPTCPGWLISDLLGHVALVYEHKVACMQEQAKPDVWPPPGDHDPDPVVRLLSAYEVMLAEFVARGPGAPAYTWHEPEQTVGFWYRRMAHETAIHRLDAELAGRSSERPAELDEDLAADGIDEMLDVVLGGDWSDQPQFGPPYAVRLETPARAWLVEVEPELVTAHRDPTVDATGDAVISASASDLDRWLWGRPTVGAIDIAGSEGAAMDLYVRVQLVT